MHRSKTCTKCHIEKPVTQYYKHEGMGDGFLSQCKDCVKLRVAKYREENIDRIRAYDRERGKKDSRLKNSAAQTKKWRQEDRRRALAHNTVSRAIKNGTLTRMPCEICGEKAYAHHDSYDKPLDVRWLCQIHHKQRHKELAMEGIDP